MDGTGFAQVIPAATPPPRRGADATTALVPEVGSAYRVRGVLHFFREQVRSTLRCKRQRWQVSNLRVAESVLGVQIFVVSTDIAQVGVSQG